MSSLGRSGPFGGKLGATLDFSGRLDGNRCDAVETIEMGRMEQPDTRRNRLLRPDLDQRT